MRNWIFAGLIALIGVGAFAADGSFRKHDTSTRTNYQLKVVDLGDGTFAQAMSLAGGGAPSPTADYKLRFKEVTSAPDSLTGTGAGLGWAVVVFGGEATFTVDGGDPAKVRAGKSVAGDFKNLSTNPVVALTALDAGATFHIFLEVGE